MVEIRSGPASTSTMTTHASISLTTLPSITATSTIPTLGASPPPDAKDSHSTAAIIGGAIGGTLALIFLLGCIFIPLIRRRRSCLDIALRRHCANTPTPATITHHNSPISEKSGQQGDRERQVDEEQKLEEMVGLEEMLKIKFPTPSRYELDTGSFVEGRANWEIKL